MLAFSRHNSPYCITVRLAEGSGEVTPDLFSSPLLFIHCLFFCQKLLFLAISAAVSSSVDLPLLSSGEDLEESSRGRTSERRILVLPRDQHTGAAVCSWVGLLVFGHAGNRGERSTKNTCVQTMRFPAGILWIRTVRDWV